MVREKESNKRNKEKEREKSLEIKDIRREGEK